VIRSSSVGPGPGRTASHSTIAAAAASIPPAAKPSQRGTRRAFAGITARGRSACRDSSAPAAIICIDSSRAAWHRAQPSRCASKRSRAAPSSASST
jgi:hypothetical protein